MTNDETDRALRSDNLSESELAGSSRHNPLSPLYGAGKGQGEVLNELPPPPNPSPMQGDVVERVPDPWEPNEAELTEGESVAVVDCAPPEGGD